MHGAIRAERMGMGTGTRILDKAQEGQGRQERQGDLDVQSPDPEKLEIDGVHRGKRFHVASHLAPDPLLIARGFRWINEAPFNR